MLWSIIIGGLIGLVAGGVTKKGGSMGVIANVLAGLIGSSVGQSLLGSWGPSLACLLYTSRNGRKGDNPF